MINENILKNYRNWKNSCPNGDYDMDLWQFIKFKIHPEDVYIISTLYFPKFVEVSGLYIREDIASSFAFQNYLKNKKLGKMETELSFNRIVLWDTFDSMLDVDLSIYENIANVMKETWRASLQKTFPELDFVILYSNSEQEYGPALSVYCDRDK